MKDEHLRKSARELSRRQFVKTTAAGAALLVVRCGGGQSTAVNEASAAAGTVVDPGGPFTLPPLPWAEDALEPHISARTMGFHHGKHHAGYVKKLNAGIDGTELQTASLEHIIQATAGSDAMQGVFNNAAQVYNHTLYWNSMSPQGGGDVPAELAERMTSSFGSVEAFVEQFKAAASGQFGSGWAWLALDGDDLKVVKTSNADTPLAHGMTPLLTIDVWEHAYYLDWQNRRGDYIDAWLEHLVSWDAALNALT